jgi:hypothetical protein
MGRNWRLVAVAIGSIWLLLAAAAYGFGGGAREGSHGKGDTRSCAVGQPCGGSGQGLFLP